MTLLTVMRKLWRYKLVTLPIIVLTLAAAAYTVAFKPPVYESNVEYILFGPPPAPSEADVLKDPGLLRGADNPYTRVGDMTVVAQLISTRLSSSEARLALAAKGVAPTYIVAPGGGFGYSTPTVQITGIGPTAQSAVKTADLVGSAMTRELDEMQQTKGVAPRYRITAQAVVPAHKATLRPSGTLRGLFGVIAAASVLLFFVVSLLDALATMRREGANDYGHPHPVEGIHYVPHAADGVQYVPYAGEDIRREPPIRPDGPVSPPRRDAPPPPAGGPRWDSGAVDLMQASSRGSSPSRRRHVDGGRAA